MRIALRRTLAVAAVLIAVAPACGGSEPPPPAAPPPPSAPAAPPPEAPLVSHSTVAPDAAIAPVAQSAAPPPQVDESQPSVERPTLWATPKGSEWSCPKDSQTKKTAKASDISARFKKYEFVEAKDAKSATWCESHGALHGPFVIVAADGKMAYGAFDHGVESGRWSRHLDASNLAQMEYRSGVPHGKLIVFSNGALKRIAPMEFGEKHGRMYAFHPNGTVESEVPYHHGTPHGLMRTWTERGALKEWALFRDGTICESHERKPGGHDEVEKKTCPPEDQLPRGKWERSLSAEFSAEAKAAARACDEGGFEACGPFVKRLGEAYSRNPAMNQQLLKVVLGLLQGMCQSGTGVASSACSALENISRQKTCFLWGYDTGCLGTGKVGKAECAPKPSVCKDAAPGETCLVGRSCTPANWGQCDCP